MPEWVILIGGFIIWFFKGCKSNLKEELDGDELINYIIGIVTVVVILGLVIWLFF